ncbi:MAG: hypothetical protein ACWGNV_00125 [Bacteroidales bacterium]
MIKKEIILKIKNVYTATAFQVEGSFFVAAGSETEPVVQRYRLRSREVEQLPDCPGGMMSFVPVPGKPNQFVSIMGLFPPFIGKEAGLYLHEFKSGQWNTTKAMALPFAHRCEIIRNGGQNYLLAASVSVHKADPSDWSKPGELHLIPLDRQGSLPWASDVLDCPVIRNHGMTKRRIKGEDVLCISGAEGIYCLERGSGDNWKLLHVFEKEVSEMSFMDLDGDGQDELVTIEPFHGETLVIYKRYGNQWKQKFTAPLAFGHGLSAGNFNGRPVVIAGNRSGSLNLEMFSVVNLDQGDVAKNVIETDAGPTQTQVFSWDGRDYILSANQRKHEVALYSEVPD